MLPGKQKWQKICLLAAVCCVWPAAADRIHLARLQNLIGDVLLVHDGRFLYAQPDMLLRPGDRVIALNDASASIVYRPRQSNSGDQACELQLGANSYVLIDNRRDCNYYVLSVPPPPPAPPPAEPSLPATEAVSCTLFDCLPEARPEQR